MKLRLLTLIYGRHIIEAYALDEIIGALSDGLPRSYSLITKPVGEITSWELTRKIDKLVSDGLINVSGEMVTITSAGMMHLAKGGYKEEIKSHRRGLFSFWFSCAAVLISLVSLFLSWLYSSRL